MVTNIQSESGHTHTHAHTSTSTRKHTSDRLACSIVIAFSITKKDNKYIVCVLLPLLPLPHQLEISKLFILRHFFCWMLVIEMGKHENCQYNGTIFTPRALSIQDSENMVASTSQSKQEFHSHCAKKETYLCTRKKGIKHTLYFSYGKSRECPINPDCDSRVNIYVHKPDWD